MLLTQEQFPDLLPVQAYEPGKLKINDQLYHHSVTLIFGQTPQAWPLQDIQHLTLAMLEPIIEQAPEVILIGTGATLIFPVHEILQEVMRHKIGIEVMDTGAACRTYNLLLAESRQVAAALIV
jgi:uncharacterized protein